MGEKRKHMQRGSYIKCERCGGPVTVELGIALKGFFVGLHAYVRTESLPTEDNRQGAARRMLGIGNAESVGDEGHWSAWHPTCLWNELSRVQWRAPAKDDAGDGDSPEKTAESDSAPSEDSGGDG